MKPQSLSPIVDARIPTSDGEFHLYLFNNGEVCKEHLALVMGDITGKEKVLTRVHSECFTGDVLGSHRCDCGEQLALSRKLIGKAGCGIIIYLRQEGRGIGLMDKLKAYNLQDLGYDTVEANLLLGHQPDEREYSIAASILSYFQVKSVCLLTNNPDKINALQDNGIEVVDRVKLSPTITDENSRYLHTKAERMNHLLDLETQDENEGNQDTPPSTQDQNLQQKHGCRW